MLKVSSPSVHFTVLFLLLDFTQKKSLVQNINKLNHYLNNFWRQQVTSIPSIFNRLMFIERANGTHKECEIVCVWTPMNVPSIFHPHNSCSIVTCKPWKSNSILRTARFAAFSNHQQSVFTLNGLIGKNNVSIKRLYQWDSNRFTLFQNW